VVLPRAGWNRDFLMSQKKPVLLTNLELAVMQVVWSAHPDALTVREVVAGINEGRRKPLAYNTVQTVLTILKEKGVVRSRAGEGRAFRFTAKRSLEEVSTCMVSDLVERLYAGQVQPLLLRLVESDSLERSELEQLKEIIETQLDDREEDC
jgi:predicted transcriptional regulator